MIKGIIEGLDAKAQGRLWAGHGDTPIEGFRNTVIRSDKGYRTDFQLGDYPILKTLAFTPKRENVIGWFATKYNPAGGYVVFELDDYDKKEFGTKNVYRVLHTKGTTIVKLDLKKGKVSFIDNEYYTENDAIKYERPFIYEILFMDNTKYAFDGFGLTKILKLNGIEPAHKI